MGEFTLFPAIDIRDGRCVRLLHGDYDQETVYGDDPVAVARDFAAQGARAIHVVDLDGARSGRPHAAAVIRDIAESCQVPVQVGGGIRNLDAAAAWLDGPAWRIVMGSAALRDPALFAQACARWPQRVVLGLDAKAGEVATDGWTQGAGRSAAQAAEELKSACARVDATPAAIVYTDISRDGALTGPNVEATVALARSSGLPVVASGGVAELEHLRQLAAHAADGIAGAIFGRAIYEGRFTVADAAALQSND